MDTVGIEPTARTLQRSVATLVHGRPLLGFAAPSGLMLSRNTVNSRDPKIRLDAKAMSNAPPAGLEPATS